MRFSLFLLLSLSVLSLALRRCDAAGRNYNTGDVKGGVNGHAWNDGTGGNVIFSTPRSERGAARPVSDENVDNDRNIVDNDGNIADHREGSPNRDASKSTITSAHHPSLSAVFEGNTRDIDVVYGSSAVPAAGTTANAGLCGDVRGYTRFVLANAARIASAARTAISNNNNNNNNNINNNINNINEINNNNGYNYNNNGIIDARLSEPSFLTGLVGSPRCLSLLYRKSRYLPYMVKIGTIVSFSDRSVAGGMRFAAAVNGVVCARDGMPGRFMWVFLDDGFPAVSPCVDAMGLTAIIGASSASPLDMFFPRS